MWAWREERAPKLQKAESRPWSLSQPGTIRLGAYPFSLQVSRRFRWGKMNTFGSLVGKPPWGKRPRCRPRECNQAAIKTLPAVFTFSSRPCKKARILEDSGLCRKTKKEAGTGVPTSALCVARRQPCDTDSAIHHEMKLGNSFEIEAFCKARPQKRRNSRKRASDR